MENTSSRCYSENLLQFNVQYKVIPASSNKQFKG